MSTAELRSALKALGYRLKLSSSSLGTCANVIHVASGSVYGNVCFSDMVERWEPFQTFADANRVALLQWQTDNGFFGVKSWFRPVDVV